MGELPSNKAYLPAIVSRAPVPRAFANPAPARRGKSIPAPFVHGGKNSIRAVHVPCRAIYKGLCLKSSSRSAQTPERQTFLRSRQTPVKARRTFGLARAPASCALRNPLQWRARLAAPSTSRGARKRSGKCRSCRARTAGIALQERGFFSFVSYGAQLPFRIRPQKNFSVRIM